MNTQIQKEKPKITEGMFTSRTDEWATPVKTFVGLNDEFGFTLDPCASDENHKCERYFTKKEDGLLQDWGGQIVFCNPPYGKVIKDWVKKGAEEARKPGTTVVMLLPARTDTAWFHDYIYHKAKEIRFLRGRLRFNEAGAAPFPSMVIVF